MAMWFYQMSKSIWTPEEYRLELWEGERWRWPVGKISGKDRPLPGDRIAIIVLVARAGTHFRQAVLC